VLPAAKLQQIVLNAILGVRPIVLDNVNSAITKEENTLTMELSVLLALSQIVKLVLPKLSALCATGDMHSIQRITNVYRNVPRGLPCSTTEEPLYAGAPSTT